MRDRSKLVLRLEHYSPNELEALIAQRAKRLGWAIIVKAVQELAIRGRGKPQLAIRLLEAVRRQSRAENATTITDEHFRQTREVDRSPHEHSPTAICYLRFIPQPAHGSACRAASCR